ncbi:MAG: TOBE domain-containing protein [Campylobacterales bacterium]|nr:TOBE domain-containing protein [Campylobacterales bacterium]
MQIDGHFWLRKDGRNFLGNGRIELLEKIAQTGSIHAAAKAMKMSYKAAWERVNAMNEIADRPIIEKTTGGRGGGGTVLTAHAYELIATYKRFAELHREFIHRFAEAGDDPERLARILSRTFLTTSARNQIACSVGTITPHGLRSELRLQLPGGDTLYSVITSTSVRNMGLEEGCDAYAIIKSSDVAISRTAPEATGDVNILKGKITSLQRSSENAEITLQLEGGSKLIGVTDLDASDTLETAMEAYATVAKNHIIIGA